MQKTEMLIYLDNAATTRVDEKVAKRVIKAMTDDFGNPSSLHTPGRKAKEELESARKEIANYLGAEPSEICFTSGGTESNNLAIKGLAEAYPEKRHIILSAIEHPSVLEVCKSLEKKGYKIDLIKVSSEGIVDLEELKRKIGKETLLVSVMHVNNEIGTIQPIEDVGKICQEKSVFFHTDAVQSFGKLEINVKEMNISLLSASGHKLNAPKGIGILYVKKGTKLSPIINGGGQEKGLRSGTENVPGAIGMAEALKIKRDKQEIKEIRDRMITELLKINKAKLNGSREKRIYNNLNFSFYGIEGESLVSLLAQDGICCSTGSACSSHKLEPSHVIKAIGTDKFYISGSLRITLGEITKQQADFVIGKIKENVEKLTLMSPFKPGEK